MLALVIALAFGGCGAASQELGTCDAQGSIGGDGATIDGSIYFPGGDSADALIEGGESGGDPNTVCENRAGQSYCWSVTPPGEAAGAPVTLADIAHFRPVVGAHTMQPKGWAVVGLPANFVSAASVHTVDGTLLGGPASVRFTAVAWHWDYGDGTGASFSSGGATWGELGAREFGATPTSHVFQGKGAYTVTLGIDLRAEYRVGSGSWTPIAGILAVEASPLSVTVTSARTVLVERDCTAYARGPGC